MNLQLKRSELNLAEKNFTKITEGINISYEEVRIVKKSSSGSVTAL